MLISVPDYPEITELRIVLQNSISFTVKLTYGHVFQPRNGFKTVTEYQTFV